MSGSPAEERGRRTYGLATGACGVLLSLSVLLLGGGSAVPQDRPAIDRGRESPTAVGNDVGRPLRLVPRFDVSPPEAAPDRPDVTADPAPRAPSGIQVDRLAQPGMDSAGTLDASAAGVPADPWRATPRHVIARTVAATPSEVGSPTLRGVVQRLLSTAADLPDEAEGRPSVPTGGIAIARVERLYAMGAVEAALALSEALPRGFGSDALVRSRADARLALHDRAGACQEVSASAAVGETSYLQRLLVYCQAMAGDTAGAALGVSLLSEAGAPPEGAFLAALDAIAGRKPPPPTSIADPNPLILSMFRTAGFPIPVDSLEKASPPALRSIAEATDTPIDVRLAAAERAAGLGALDYDALANLYTEVPASPEEVSRAIAGDADNPRGRALLYQSALAQTVPVARAEVLQRALVSARANGTFLVAVRVHRDLLVGLPPSADLSWFAADAAVALLAAGDGRLAKRWFDVLEQSAARDDVAAEKIREVWPLRQFSDDVPTPEPDALLRFVEQSLAEEDGGTERVEAVLALFDAAGVPVPDAAWWSLQLPALSIVGEGPAFALVRLLRRAVDANRRGEALLLATRLFEGAGARTEGIAAATETVRTLYEVGLRDEARALAVETLIARER